MVKCLLKYFEHFFIQPSYLDFADSRRRFEVHAPRENSRLLIRTTKQCWKDWSQQFKLPVITYQISILHDGRQFWIWNPCKSESHKFNYLGHLSSLRCSVRLAPVTNKRENVFSVKREKNFFKCIDRISFRHINWNKKESMLHLLHFEKGHSEKGRGLGQVNGWGVGKSEKL